MKVNMEYADSTVSEEHDKVIIYDNDDKPICEITKEVINVFGMDDHYSSSPSETFDHLKVFPLLPVGKDL